MRQAATAVTGLLLAVIFQSYFFGAWRPLGVLPNLLLVMLTYLALLRPASQSLAAALAGGLLLDLTSGVDFGLRMAFYSFFVLGVTFARQLGAGADSLGSVLGLVAAGTLAYDAAVLGSLVISRTSLGAVTIRQVAVELIINLVLALLLSRFLRWWLKSAPEGLVPG